MTWLHGGPYYELSFLFKNEGKKHRTILNQIQNNVFELANNSKTLEEYLSTFEIGEKADGKTYRFLDIDIWVLFEKKRKARLYLAELSEHILLLNFWFFGSIYDAPEWEQKGIRESDKPMFRNLFNQIIKLLVPIAGTIGYEEDARNLFDTNECFPHKDYNIDKIDFTNRKVLVEFEHYWLNPMY